MTLPNRKLKLLYLMKIFKELTDEEHGITMAQIIEELQRCGVSAERKSIYTDISELELFGMNIEIIKRAGNTYYHLMDRDFELPELKLLVDAVQSSKFITEKKSNNLIKKIEGLASKHQAKEIQSQVYVANRIKANNESVFYNVDDLNFAINKNSKVNFDYYEWNAQKKLQLRNNGHKNNISPWVLTWDDENYYLVAYDADAKMIKHYRVDKMRNIELTNEARDGKEDFDRFDVAVYAKKVFGMFTGTEEEILMECSSNMIGVIIDRFGRDIIVVPKSDDKFTVRVRVKVIMSNMFLGWIMGLGDGVKIIAPDSAVGRIKLEVKRLINQYGTMFDGENNGNIRYSE